MHRKWNQNADYWEASTRIGTKFDLAKTLIEARLRSGFTQSRLATRMETTQSEVARMESGRVPPSMRTLGRFARATGTRLRINFEPA
ncbi:MAG: helix-turn-helix transcriptional regulator [Gammaproteobacteria bacterium]|nr:helix-turn-helix transcriptional regulator [Gammaproteobacteria bacterium]MCY4277302.1 helix-turn-helix transcriptional regulator [Gammaproteobacteria bacterium]